VGPDDEAVPVHGRGHEDKHINSGFRWADFKKGDRVLAYWGERWWPAEVTKTILCSTLAKSQLRESKVALTPAERAEELKRLTLAWDHWPRPTPNIKPRCVIPRAVYDNFFRRRRAGEAT
jgi:hypothetical protein